MPRDTWQVKVRLLAIALLATALIALAALGGTAQPAAALDEPGLPDDVANYFATGLVPRLANLYGTTIATNEKYDSTAKAGGIRRESIFSKDFLAGRATDTPTQLVNYWVAPVTFADQTTAGLAIVWINPTSDEPELADYSVGSLLPDELAKAPAGTILVANSAHKAWFAFDGTTITPLVAGTSKITKAVSLTEAHKLLTVRDAPPAPTISPARVLLIAAVLLGVLVLVLLAFVLLPLRREPHSP